MKQLVFCAIFAATQAFTFDDINLPPEHLPVYFSNNKEFGNKCLIENCKYKQYVSNKKIRWGYELDSQWKQGFIQPDCAGDHKGWVQTKEDQIHTFHTQADFGYIRQQMKEMQVLCEAMFPNDGSLECSDHMRFCRGRNLMINFTKLEGMSEPIRYKMDVLQHGDIGGYCKLHQQRLEESTDHLSPLQSWAPELRFFNKLPREPFSNTNCDVIVEKPTVIMKIDATVNMYHHFCDFLNLYASQHLNALGPEAFSTDIHILIWESFTYRSSFQTTFDAFTKHPIWDLKTFRGKTVCFKNIVFPLLPRMIFGLYYNTPLIYGCQGSSLFNAFSKHILHRLEIPVHQRTHNKTRITLISRDTKHRRILNEEQLVEAMGQIDEYSVRKVVFNRDVSFKSQMEVIRNTDILIGIHGAGLTHLLFLPDWAAVFELYNCEDASCYMDLSRLRGLKYVTWENASKLYQQDSGSHPDGGAHAKFTNYSFDVQEFLRILSKAATHVQKHPKYVDDLTEAMCDKSETLNLGTAEPIDVDELHDDLTAGGHDEL